MKKLLSTITLTSIAINLLVAQIPEDKWVYIRASYSADHMGFWDQPQKNAKFQKGAALELRTIEPYSKDMLYKFVKTDDGYYNIIPKNDDYKGRLDVPGGKQVAGSPMHFWEKNGSGSQKFKIEYVGKGEYKISTTRGKVLTADGYKDGTKVKMGEDSKSSRNKWCFIEGIIFKKYNPDNIPKYPAFFADNKNKVFKYQEQYSMGGGFEGTAKVLKTTVNSVFILATCKTISGNDKNKSLERKIELSYKDGIYKTSDNYNKGEVALEGNKLDLGGGESAIVFELSK